MKQEINGIYTGKIIKKYGMTSAIDKHRVEGSLYLSSMGLAEDECAETRFHGGLERALHHYPSEHYQQWQEQYGMDPNWQAPGMGENISTLGMTEKDVYIGERFQWGEAIIEVSQPRSPCFKLNKRWGVEDISLSMQTTGRCGWLYRVIQAGQVSANDWLISQGVPDNSLSVDAVLSLFFGDPLNREGLLRLADLSLLSDEWREPVKRRLATNTVENWQSRLFGVSANR